MRTFSFLVLRGALDAVEVRRAGAEFAAGLARRDRSEWVPGPGCSLSACGSLSRSTLLREAAGGEVDWTLRSTALNCK